MLLDFTEPLIRTTIRSFRLSSRHQTRSMQSRTHTISYSLSNSRRSHQRGNYVEVSFPTATAEHGKIFRACDTRGSFNAPKNQSTEPLESKCRGTAVNIHPKYQGSFRIRVSNFSLLQQKQKREHPHNGSAPPDYTKPSAIFRPGRPRTHTLSIALPGSIIAKCACQSPSLPSRPLTPDVS